MHHFGTGMMRFDVGRMRRIPGISVATLASRNLGAPVLSNTSWPGGDAGLRCCRQIKAFMKYLAPFAVLLLAGCVSQPSVQSWLDPVSMATITAQAQPTVLARLQKRRTAEGRDYAQLTAIEVNRMGERKLYLVAVLWSNAQLTGKQWQSFEHAFEQIEVLLDGQALALTRLPEDVSALGIGQTPLPLPIPGSRQIYYPIDRPELRAMVASNRIKVMAQGWAEAPQPFGERENGRRSLNDFLSQLPGESSSISP
jgi:hypothetical protein